MKGIVCGIIGILLFFCFVRILNKKHQVDYEDSVMEGRFVVRNGKEIKIIVIICTVGIGLLWLLCLYVLTHNVSKDNLFGVLVFTLAFIVAIYAFLDVVNWCLIIDGMNITYINWLGKKSHYSFKELNIKVKSNLSLKVFANNHKVFVIENHMDNSYYFFHWAEIYKIPIDTTLL